mmetsp:Transcript_56645/g.50968  ORF Transcript_56645/g.50968 Transcript_56645/m.50968 type:complete len:165 (-) Transcript_56645:172-666(-)
MSIKTTVNIALFVILINNVFDEQQPESSLINRLLDNGEGASRKLLGVGAGGSCTAHIDCDGWGAGAQDMACCQAVCEQKKLDWAGVGYCAFECKGCPTCSLGTCPLKSLGESCNVNQDCDQGSCCNGTCQYKKRDWANICYCPNTCVGSIGGAAGTCQNRADCL